MRDDTDRRRNNDGDPIVSPGPGLRAIRAARGFTPTEKLVLCMVLSHTDGKTGLSFARYRTLAEETGLSESTVNAAMAKLYDRGVLVRESKHNRASDRHPGAWEVRFALEALEAHDAPVAAPTSRRGGDRTAQRRALLERQLLTYLDTLSEAVASGRLPATSDLRLRSFMAFDLWDRLAPTAANVRDPGFGLLLATIGREWWVSQARAARIKPDPQPDILAQLDGTSDAPPF